MSWLKIVLLLFLLSFLGPVQALAQISNSEGILSNQHDLSLQKRRSQYFWGADGKLDTQKLNNLKVFLLEQKRLLEDSARLSKKVNLIDDHDYDDERASKSANKTLNEEAEILAPILFALESTEDLLQNHGKYSPLIIHEKVETTLLWLSAAYTIYPKGIFTALTKRIENLVENFFEFNINDSNELQASNLLKEGRFQSQADLKKFRLEGGDISKLDPPTSAFWENNEVEKYEPENEIYFGKKLFPNRKIQVPVFYFSRMGNGTIKFKADWFDEDDLNKKGQPKKKKMTMRVGFESYTNSVVNHMARIIGYPATPTTYREKVKLELGETTFEHFLSLWKRIHSLEQGSAISHVERIPGENAVYLKGVTLEAYPDDEDYRRIAPFRMGDSGFRNRREYRAMVLYNALISLQDHFEYQSRVDAFRDPSTGQWKPIFFMADTSSALGLPGFLGNVGTPNEFTWEYTKIRNQKLHIFWFSVFDPRTWEDTTYSDVKWLARRIARISSSQIDKIMKTSGFPAPAQLLYAEKFKSRINQMIRDMDLLKEGAQLHKVISLEEIHRMYPNYIDRKGFLKQNAQEYPGNTLPILGDRFTPYQRVIVGGLNAIQNKLLSFIASGPSISQTGIFDLGQFKSEQGFLFEAKREVSVNSERGPGQMRYLLKDTFSVNIPIGFDRDKLTTPIAYYYTYSFTYFHSVTEIQDTFKKRFFSMMNPFDLNHIKRNLAVGEQLIVNHGTGASAGRVKVKATDDLKFEAALFNISNDRIKTVYFAKPTDQLLEIAVDSQSQKVFRNGIDLRALIAFGAMTTHQWTDSQYRLYRLDLLNEDHFRSQSLKEAFEKALVYNDFHSLNAEVRPLKMDEQAKKRFFNLNLFFWNIFNSQSAHEAQVHDELIYVAKDTQSLDRAFDRLWNEKIDPKVTKPMINYFGNFWNEGEALELSFEGQANSSLTHFDGAELKINFSKFDMFCTRSEFEMEFKPYFNSRSGQASYVNFDMPPGLNAYPELIGQMRWQINAKALRQILEAATDWKNLTFLEPKNRGEKVVMQDPREVVSYRAQKVLEPLDSALTREAKRKLLKEKAQDIIFVVKSMIGEEGERVSSLRRLVSEKDIWIITSIEEMLDLSHPTFNARKGEKYFAPEVGQFQGHSFLEKFRRQNLVRPVFQQ